MRASSLKLAVPLAIAALAAFALALAGTFLGGARGEPTDDDAPERAHQEPAPGTSPEPAPEPPERTPARSDGRADAAVRPGPSREPVEPASDEYRCVQPALTIPQQDPCTAGRGYPDCRWQIPEPDAEAPLFTLWRNTTPEHRWGRPGLVSLVLASAAEYQRRWPGERLSIGDLDAPGPRHATHDRGVDVDLYLPDAMMTRNEGRGRYVSNYEQRRPSDVRRLRARVLDLGRILAVCANGQIRIYYNDPEIVGPFREWFDARGLRSDVGLPMRPHNRLHEFHYHLTVRDEIAPLPTGAEADGQGR